MKLIGKSLFEWEISPAGGVTPPPSAPVAPTAGGALSDLTLELGAAMTPVDLSSDFTGTGITYALAPSSAALPSGLSLSSSGVLSGTPGALASGSVIVVRGTNVGGFVDSAFQLSVIDTRPDAFNFTDLADQSLNTQVTSDTITPTGFTAATAVTISGGEYRILNIADQLQVDWTSSPNSMSPTDKIQVRTTTSVSNAVTTNVTISIGGTVDIWSVTTINSVPDTIPDNFAFNDLSGQALSTQVTSNILVLTGYDSAISVSVDAGEFQITDASDQVVRSWGSAGASLNPGEKLQLRITSSASNATAVSINITAGGVLDTWTVTTLASGTYPVYRVGDTLNAAGATQWTRGGSAISGATGTSYTLQSADELYVIDCDDGSFNSVFCCPAAVIPSHTTSIVGDYQVGEQLLLTTTALSSWPYASVSIDGKVAGVSVSDGISAYMRLPDQVGDAVSFDTVAQNLFGSDSKTVNGSTIIANTTGPVDIGVDDPVWHTNVPALDSQGSFHPYCDILKSGSGVRADWSPITMTVQTALTGSAETAIVVDAIDANIPQTGWLRFSNKVMVKYTSWTGTTFTIPATDFRFRQISAGATANYDLLQYNLIAGGKLNASGFPVSDWSGKSYFIHWNSSFFTGRTFTINYTGTGTITVGGGASTVSSSAGTLTFTVTSSSFWLNISAGSALTAATCVASEHAALFAAGGKYTPEFMREHGDMREIRFMDFLRTNGHVISDWADRPKSTWLSYADGFGAPLEAAIEIANDLACDGHFNCPHLADNNYMTQFATLILGDLDTNRHANLEWGNEGWNSFTFGGAEGIYSYLKHLSDTIYGWSDATNGAGSGSSVFERALNAYARRSSEFSVLVKAVWSAALSRLYVTGGTQTVNTWVTQRILNAECWQNADSYYSDSLSQTLGAPSGYLDAIAVTTYFGNNLFNNPFNLQTQFQAVWDAGGQTEVDAWLHSIMLDPNTNPDPNAHTIPDVCTFLRNQQSICASAGVAMIGYEGGTHMVYSNVNTAAFDAQTTLRSAAIQFSDSYEMVELYSVLFKLWMTLADGPCPQYRIRDPWSSYGAWGWMQSVSHISPTGLAMLHQNRIHGNTWGGATTGYKHANILYADPGAGPMTVIDAILSATPTSSSPTTVASTSVTGQKGTIIRVIVTSDITPSSVTMNGVAADPIGSFYAGQSATGKVLLYASDEISGDIVVTHAGYTGPMSIGVSKISASDALSLPVTEFDSNVPVSTSETSTLAALTYGDDSVILHFTLGQQSPTITPSGFTHQADGGLPGGGGYSVDYRVEANGGTIAPAVTFSGDAHAGHAALVVEHV